jgi:hypothetical protein
MRKYLIFLVSGLILAVAGCASMPAQSTAPDSTASAAVAQPAAQPTTSQNREDRIKESDAVRRSMGY